MVTKVWQAENSKTCSNKLETTHLSIVSSVECQDCSRITLRDILLRGVGCVGKRQAQRLPGYVAMRPVDQDRSECSRYTLDT